MWPAPALNQEPQQELQQELQLEPLQSAVLQCLGWETRSKSQRGAGIVMSVFYRIKLLMSSVLPVRQQNLVLMWSPKLLVQQLVGLLAPLHSALLPLVLEVLSLAHQTVLQDQILEVSSLEAH